MHKRMHWSVVAAAVTAMILSGCVSPKGSLSELGGDDFASSFLDAADDAADSAAGAVRAPVIERTPVEEPVEEVVETTPPPEPAPQPQGEPEAEPEAPPAAEPAPPAASDNETEAAPPTEAEAAPAPEPAADPIRSEPCVTIEIDSRRDVLRTEGHATSAARDQAQSAAYDIYHDNLDGRAIVDSGIAVGVEHHDDFCHLDEAYPCVFGNAFAKPDHSRYRWNVAYGFTNVTDGTHEMAYNGEHQKFYETTYVVRGWLLLEGGTLVLEPPRDVASWGHLTSSTHTNSIADREEFRQFCDVNASGLLPEAMARA